jgi:hypothetical protein
MQQYRAYSSIYPRGRDVIDGALWDTLPYVSGAAGTTRLDFFATVKATVDLSNMRAAGQLPVPESFLVRSIRVYFHTQPQGVTGAAGLQAGMIENVAVLAHQGALTFNVGQTDWGMYPLDMLPAGGGVSGRVIHQGVAAATVQVEYAQNGVPEFRNSFALAVPVLIEPQVNFRCVVTWPGTAAFPPAAPYTLVLPAGILSLMITVVLMGDHSRGIQ